ncbi:MAG TPA: hypothetical protein VE987_05800 [Polyangiaceae bacterium]|nr:hypothetical protein [Polyangiaceae bacterium]
MHILDWLSIALVVAAGAAFVMGEVALARADDLQALYWLAVGIASLRAGVQVARPGAKA